MKFAVTRPTEIEVTKVRIECGYICEYDEIPETMVGKGVFSCYVWMETGEITFPKNIGPCRVHIKARDAGVYTLIGADNLPIATLQDYVPHGVVPGSYGDYIELEIDENNFITNWPGNPDISAWFQEG